MNQVSISVFRVKPKDFSPSVEVAACYIESNGKLLFLKKATGSPQGGRWGVAGGKIEKGESVREAAIRETREETGIHIEEERLKFIGKIFVRKPGIDFVYHMHRLRFSYFPMVSLNEEHQEYRWLSEEDLVNLPLMAGGIEVFYHFKDFANKPELIRKPFYFIRHGETDVNTYPNIKHVDYDLPLNNKGRNQAQLACVDLDRIPLKSVCFSPIQRAVETKDILVTGLKIEQVEMNDLAECKAHVWTKMIKLEKGHGFHIGDEVKNFLDRTLRGLHSALEKQWPTLIVAHGGIHWAFCYHMMIENHPWKIENCKLVYFQPVRNTEWKAEIIH